MVALLYWGKERIDELPWIHQNPIHWHSKIRYLLFNFTFFIWRKHFSDLVLNLRFHWVLIGSNSFNSYCKWFLLELFLMLKCCFQNMLIEMPINWRREYKPISSISVGASPELEVALYTICFLTRPNGSCPLEAGGVRFRIQSFTTNYQGKRFIGTTYPSF